MDGWMDGWMDKEVLIRYLDEWMTRRKPFELGARGGVRWGGPCRVVSLKPSSQTVKLTRIFTAMTILC